MKRPLRYAALASILLSVLVTQAALMPVQAQSATSVIELDSGSQKIPEGTQLPVRFNQTLDTQLTQVGENFSVTLMEDLLAKTPVAGSNGAIRPVILPKGTLIRGVVTHAKPSSWFSRGGMMLVSFVHAVLPSGDLLPLSLSLSLNNQQVRRVETKSTAAANLPTRPDAGIYSDPGIPVKLKHAANDGGDVFNSATAYGRKAGQQWGNGAGQYVTVPVAAVGGALGAGAVTAAKGVQALVGKGDNARIAQGQVVIVDFSQSVDVQQ